MTTLEGLWNSPLAIVSVDDIHKTEYQKLATSRYGLNFKMIQLVWCDQFGKYPWDSGYNDSYREVQPILGEFTKGDRRDNGST